MEDKRIQEALDLMQEECAEIIHIISKIRRFGLDSYNPYHSERKSNQQLLSDEIGDFELLKRYLVDADILSEHALEARIIRKLPALRKYTNLDV